MKYATEYANWNVQIAIGWSSRTADEPRPIIARLSALIFLAVLGLASDKSQCGEDKGWLAGSGRLSQSLHWALLLLYCISHVISFCILCQCEKISIMPLRNRPYVPKIKGTLRHQRAVAEADDQTGCYECSQRRIHCDRKEPACEKCIAKGISCSGLGMRFRFRDASKRRGPRKHTLPPYVGSLSSAHRWMLTRQEVKL